LVESGWVWRRWSCSFAAQVRIVVSRLVLFQPEPQRGQVTVPQPMAAVGAEQ
jgi:hypothetical protein